MATLLGVVGPFNPDTDDWVVYFERLEQFFKANGISDPEKQRAVLLSTCGNETYLPVRGGRLNRKKTLWVDTVTNFFDSSSKANCK